MERRRSMAWFKPKQDPDETLRSAIKALLADDSDQFSRVAGKLSKYPVKEVIASLAFYGLRMRQAGVGDDLINRVVVGMAPDEEPAKAAFIEFGKGVFSGDSTTAAEAANRLYSWQGVDADERGDLLLLTIVTAGRIAERHDLPI
jgi:hypothetical protein